VAAAVQRARSAFHDEHELACAFSNTGVSQAATARFETAS